jgi:hypothetical protein
MRVPIRIAALHVRRDGSHKGHTYQATVQGAPGHCPVMYMLRGDGGASNTDPYSMKEEPGNNWIKTGSHVMIVGSGAKMLDGYPREAKADPTKPYVMWPGTAYEHLMLPVR